MSKLKASDVIDIDDEFLEKIASRLFEKKQVSEYYTVEQVAKKISRTPHTVRSHIRNYKNEITHKPNLRGIKIGKDWLVSEEDLNEYLSNNKNRG